eukprot:scaffold12213_cov115-Isochrysis_galbana.AAC.3
MYPRCNNGLNNPRMSTARASPHTPHTTARDCTTPASHSCTTEHVAGAPIFNRPPRARGDQGVPTRCRQGREAPHGRTATSATASSRRVAPFLPIPISAQGQAPALRRRSAPVSIIPIIGAHRVRTGQQVTHTRTPRYFNH